MKSRIILVALALMGAGAWAADPVAVWDRDFTTMTQGTYTLSENGNTKTESYLQISGDNGITVTSTDALNVFTVIMRCSGLNLAAENAQVLFTSYVSDSQANLTGYYLLSGNSNTKGIWDGADWSSESGATKNPVPANYTTLIYNHQQTNGTYGYALGPTSSEDETVVRTTLYSVVGLRSSGKTYCGFNIGGLRGTTSTTLLPATGLKITSLAVFSGTLTETEMKSYIFPSEIQTINVSAADSIAVSEINNQIDANTYKTVKVVAEDGATITVDEALSTALPIAVSSTGSITLSAESQPDASYFTGVDFSGVQGGLLRSWLSTPGVVGFNFNSANGTDTSAALVAGEWQSNASDASGSADLFGDGLSAFSWGTSLYQRSGASSFLDGYIDDAWSGNGATITLSNVPYETYDVVIYASTDSGSVFTAKTVNGTAYTWNAVQSAAVQGAGTWGSVGASSAIYGVNSLRIKNLSGPLTIYGGSRTNPARGGIAAIQIMPTDAPDIVKTYTLTLDGSATTWSAGTWTLDGESVSAPTAGNVAINATASTTLTLDADVMLGDVTVNGDDNIVVTLALGEKTAASGDTAATYYSFYANKVAVDSGVLQQGSSAVLGTTPVVSVADGATFDLNGLAPNGATVFYLAGDGAGNWPYALTSSSGEFSGTIKNMYLTGDAAIGGEYKIVLGANWDASYCYLQNHTLVKTGTGELLVRNWNIPDDGTVIVRGGELHTDQWNCLNKNTSGTVTLKIEADGTVRGTNQQSNPPAATTLDWEGTLNTASRTFIVKSALSGGGTTANLNFEANATANLKRDLTITSSLTLSGDASFLKSPAAASGVTVSVTGTLADAATGTITVGAGVTLNLGINRPAGTLTIDDAGALVVQMASATDIVELKASAQPANITLYDENGTVVTEPRITYSAGTLTIAPPLPTLVANGLVAFDTEANWDNSHIPTAGEDAIIELEGDAEVTVANTYTLGSLTITGAGVVSFAGEGSITATTINLRNGATLVRNANISASTGIDIASGTVLRLDGVTENAAISGAGAVETYGAVTFNASNTFTGGLTVKSGSEANTIKTEIGGQAYGKNNYGQAIANLSRIVVEDGGSLDLANTADACYAITISGKGVYDAQSGVYKGALYNSGSEIGQTSRQTASLTLAADAMVKAESSNNGWGIVNSGYAASVLALNGHTLTVSGAGYFPIVNANTASGTQTTGTLIADGVTLGLVSTASNLTGVDVIAKGCATINLATAPTALGSLTLKPSATGTTASNWNLPSGFVPAVDTFNIDAANLTVGQVLPLFTAPSATELTAETIAVTADGRYTTTISGYTVTAKVVDVLSNPFIHYDFNAANAIAADSRYNVGNLNPALVNSNKGKAGTFDSTYRPYYGSNSSNKSPFYAGEMSVMSLIKIKEANNTILWNLGNGLGDGIALIAKDAKTVALVSWTGGADGSDVVAVAGESDITNAWHLVTIVADGDGTTLYVDDQSATVDTVLPNIGGKGQFGSIHGTAKNYNAVAGDGYLLDDWRIYDAALTADEIATFREDFLKTVTITVPKVDHTTVTVGTAEVDVLDVIDHDDTYTYTVITGATVKVSYTSDDYEVTGGEFEFAATDDYTVDTTGVTTTLYVASVMTGETTTKYTSIKAAIDATSGGAATITVLTASSENLTIHADKRVAIDDASGLFTGDITVEESGILDLSNRTAADCVACTNLTLAAGAGLWLPEGVTGSVKVAENLIADALVDVKIGDAYTQTFTVASSDTGVLALRALRATAKPVAVWNADFEDGVKHGNVALNLNGNAVQNGIITITDSDALGTAIGGGVRFEIETSTITNRHLTAIVGIKTNEVDLAKEPYLVTVAHHNNNAATDVLYDKVGLLLKAASDTYQAGTIRGIWDASEWVAGNSVTGAQWPAGEDKHYFTYRYNATSSTSYDAEGRSTSGVFGTDGTTAYFDGDTDNAFYSASNLRNSGNSTKEFIRAMTLGGYYYADTTERHQRSLTGATIDYVAIFTQDDYATEDAIKAWTLASVTQAETVPATATAITDGSGVGVNLNGGTITIDSQIMAAAVFVQEDTTLKFTGSGRLDVANNGMYLGPVYVAEGKTLTIDASASAITAGELIHGAVYGNVAIDEATGLAYIADGGLYVGVRPTETHTLTIVVNGNHAFGDGNFTGLDTLGIIGTGAVYMATCTLEAGEFALGAGVSLTLDGASSLDAAAMAIDGVLAAACPVTATTLTVNGEFTAAGAVTATTVKAVGSLAIAEGGSLAASTLSVDGVATASGAIAATTVTVGGSLAIEEGGSLEATTLTVAGEFTTAGNVTATTVNANGDFTVADGGQLTVNGDRGLSGTVTVAKGGTLTSGIGNAMNWDGKCVVHLYGTLEMGETSWAVNTGNGNRLYLYEGCVITGTSNENSAFDLVGTDEAIIVTGAVEVAQRLRFRADSKILVNADSRLTLSGELCYMEGQIGSLVKHGPGTLEITGTMTQPSPKGLDIAEGTVVLGSGASVAGTVRVQGEGVLDVSALASPVIAGAVTLDKFATVVVPANANLSDGVQLTKLADEGALTVNSYATLVQGDTTYTNATVQVLENNKLAMVAQTTHAATITGETAWADIAWTPALPADPTGRKLIINASAGAVIDGGAIAKTADSIVFNVAQDSILTITNLTLTANLITVNGGAVKVYSADTLTGAFTGSGTIVYNGVMPASPADKFTNTSWQGTVWLEHQTNVTEVTFANFGSKNSTIKLTDMQLYCRSSEYNGTLELSNADSDGAPAAYALEINNGYSNETVTFARLTGSGTFQDTSSSVTQPFVFTDVSGFKGSIRVVGKRIKIGAGSQAASGGQIVVQPGVTATIAGDATWSAANGLHVYGTVNVEGKIDGSVQCHDSGKFVVTSGNAVLGDLRDFTYVTLDAGTEVDWVSVEQTKLEAIDGRTRVENIADANIKYINFIKYNGDEVKVAKDADNVAELEEDPQVSGDVCWYDFTFTKEWYDGQANDDTTVKNIAGSASGVLQLDKNYKIKDNPTAFNSTNGNLRIRATPYFDKGTITYPDNFSVAMYTMMPERTNDVLMAFGTVAGGYLAVVRGDGPNEIRVVWGQNATKQEIAAFSVVAATQTRHLIMFTKSGQEIAVYLDGDATPLAKETLASGRTIANQFQVASIHGGEDTDSTGLQRPAATEKAELAMLRIYDYVLQDRMIAKLAAEFPVEAWDNFALRALDAANGTNTWYDAVNRPWSYTTDGKAVISAEVENGIQPLDDAHIVISNVSELTQWVDVVLPTADSGAGNFTVAGTSPVIIHHSIGGHAVDVAGAISNEVDLTIYYGAINMANTRLYMTESATLKLELTEFLRDCEAAGDYTLTGICGNFGGRVSCSAESDNLFFSVDGGIKYDSDRQRYYVTVVAKRSDPQDVYLTVDGSNITVGADTSVYYLVDGTAQRYTRLITGDKLYLDGTVGSVTLSKDYGLAGYDIPAGVTLVADNFQVKGTITGAGTLRCIGQHPKVDDITINSLQNAAGWTGTVEIENCNLGATRLDNFGNASSTLRLIGCSVALSDAREETIGLDLADTVDGRTYDYGLWFKGVSGSDGAVAVYPALTGQGTLCCTNSATTVTYLRIPDMGGFLGTIDQAIAATGGIKLVLGDTGTADLSGLVGDSSMYVSDDTVWQVYGDVAAATNLTVKGTLLATGIAPKVAAEQIVFDGGKVVIGEPAAYPMLQGTVTGAIEVDFADGLAGDSITALAHLGAEAATTLTLTPVGNAAKYTVQREEGEQEDGTFTVYYKLIRNFFYIRVR